VAFLTALFNILAVLVSLFLICLVLIQRGKGGGLAGAFGGTGGSSAFGTKAGDVFTKITIVTASVWFGLLMILVILSNQKPKQFEDFSAGTSTTVPGASSKASTESTAPSDLVPPPVGGAQPTPKTTEAPPAPVSSSGPAAPSPELPKKP
jgi:preprotein translocase subunit SecG